MNPDEPLRTRHLAEEDPAPMDDTLGGYPWLPRMIDKARASHAGVLGPYFRYPCPIDTVALGLLGIQATSFERLAVTAAYGQDILEQLSALGSPSPDAIRFDPVELNRELHDTSS